MKILFTLTPALDPNSGGVQHTTYKLGRYFTEQGLSVCYYSLDLEGHVDISHGRLFAAPEEGGTNNPANIIDLEKLLSKEKPNIVINQMPYDVKLSRTLALNKVKHGYSLIGCLRNSLFSVVNNLRDTVRRAMPKPIFLMMDNHIGLALMLWMHKRKHTKALKAILDAHDKYVLLTPSNNEELKYFVGNYQREKVLSIPNSIPSVSEESIEHKQKIILHVGRLSVQQKRPDLLLPFWEKVSSILHDWKFIIIGDGPYLTTLQEQVREKSLERIELLGKRQPDDFYRDASIFMMPSAFEGFPNTILEAQSFGCPVLAYDSYLSLAWIVNHEKDALLSPAFDVENMSANAIELGLDKDLRVAYQMNALTNAKRFLIDNVGRMWLDLFDEVKK